MSTSRLASRVSSFLHISKEDVNLEQLDPANNPNITFAEDREEQLRPQVAFARNWYREVFVKAMQGSISWDSHIDIEFCNPDWNWEDACRNHDASAEDRWDLAPEEYVQDGEVRVSEDWIAEHQCTTKASSPNKDRVKNFFAHVKGMGRSRSSMESGSPGSDSYGTLGSSPTSAPSLSDFKSNHGR